MQYIYLLLSLLLLNKKLNSQYNIIFKIQFKILKIYLYEFIIKNLILLCLQKG